MAQISIKKHYGGPKIKSVILVGQKSVIYYIQVVVVGILSVVLVESVILVTVILVVVCTMQEIPSIARDIVIGSAHNNGQY